MKTVLLQLVKLVGQVLLVFAQEYSNFDHC